MGRAKGGPEKAKGGQVKGRVAGSGDADAFGRAGNGLRELREKRPSLLVEETSNVHNFGALAMTRHGSGSC